MKYFSMAKWFENYENFKFESVNVNLICNSCKTYCNANRFLNKAQNLISEISCKLRFPYLKFLEINLC